MKRTFLIQHLLLCWISNASLLLCMGHWRLEKKKKTRKKKMLWSWEHTIKTLCALFQWTCILIWLSAICNGHIHFQGLLLSQGPGFTVISWSHIFSTAKGYRSVYLIIDVACCCQLKHFSGGKLSTWKWWLPKTHLLTVMKIGKKVGCVKDPRDYKGWSWKMEKQSWYTTAANQERIEKNIFLRKDKFDHWGTQKSLIFPMCFFRQVSHWVQ